MGVTRARSRILLLSYIEILKKSNDSSSCCYSSCSHMDISKTCNTTTNNHVPTRDVAAATNCI